MSRRSLSHWPLALLTVGSSFHALTAVSAGIPSLQEVVVSANSQDLTGIADSATEGTVTAQQLANRPLLRPAEVLETVPGLTVTQHSGDGKANQYFLRGFNLDHGSDFATSVMGMPVNMVSHAHGQGYMDLNFLIPELVGSLRYRKGVYSVEDGDFSSTGSAHIDYQRQVNAPYVDLGLGQNGYRRALGVSGKEINGQQWLGALELMGNDGPWDQPENLRRSNGVLRLSEGNSNNGYSLALMAYRGSWVASEHVPQRAIDSGEIGRYGTLLANDGGITHRASLSGEWAQSGEADSWKASAYMIDYGLNLFSSPSGFITGSQGDQHEQADRRVIVGGQVDRRIFLDATELGLGLQLRHDNIGTLGLYNTVDRARTQTVREDKVSQTATALYGETKTQWLPWLRSSLGLRYDRIDADVTALAGSFNMSNGGKASASQTSPKLGLALGPFAGTELYANWGRGFHSNDARGATTRVNPADGTATDPVPLMVRSQGSELGLRTSPLPGWHSNLSLWRMELASELVFVGDAGITEPRGASRRQGLEWANYVVPAPGWIVDADLALSQARFKEAVNGGIHVPNAIPLSISVAASYDDGSPWSGGVRLRYIGAYDLEETGQQKSSPFWTANLKMAYRYDSRLRFSLDLLNLFDRKANDIEYWGAACSRQDGAGCNGGNGIDGKLVHPLEPRTLRLGMRVSF